MKYMHSNNALGQSQWSTRTKELGVKPFLFISLLFYKPVMSSQVIISSAKPCKQSEITITFAYTNHVLSNQFLRLLSCREAAFFWN